MHKKILAVLDPDITYVTRFMEYGNQKKDFPFVIRAFTDPDALMSFLGNHSVEILLLSDLIHLDKPPKAGLTVRLSEIRSTVSAAPDPPGYSLVRDGAPQKKKEIADPPVIFKYQASSVVLKKLVDYYEKDQGSLPETAACPETEILGVFSPVGRSGKTTFALALGECLALKKPTLLLNLESCSGWKELLHESWDRDLSLGIFALRSGEGTPASFLADAVKKIGELSYIPPFAYVPDLFSITCEEWDALIHDIACQMPFEAVIIDFGDLPWANPRLLLSCSHLFMPVLQNETAKAKINEFLMYIQPIAAEEDMPKPENVSVLDQKIPENSDRRIELLPYSALGAYVRKLIAQDML